MNCTTWEICLGACAAACGDIWDRPPAPRFNVGRTGLDTIGGARWRDAPPFRMETKLHQFRVSSPMRAALLNIEFGGEGGPTCTNTCLRKVDPLKRNLVKWCNSPSFHRRDCTILSIIVSQYVLSRPLIYGKRFHACMPDPARALHTTCPMSTVLLPAIMLVTQLVSQSDGPSGPFCRPGFLHALLRRQVL